MTRALARLIAAAAITTALSASVACDGPALPVTTTAPTAERDRLPVNYVLVGPGGARAFPSLPLTGGRAATSGGVALQAGFGFVVTDRRTTADGSYVRLGQTGWVATRDVVAVRPSTFTGITLASGAALDAAWVVVAQAIVRSTADQAGRAIVTRPFHTRLTLSGPCRAGWCPLPVGWVAARDLAVPVRQSRPTGVAAAERWLDVDLEAQTLVAYQGDLPVFTTLVSTGIGQGDSPFATPTGTFTISAKAERVRMDNLEHTGVVFYSYDVPLAQVFSPGKALHAALWHDRFGRPASHGCVNLSPADAAWLFTFTSAGRGRRGTVVHIHGQRPPIAAR